MQDVKTAPRPRFQCASHSVGYKSSKSGCKTQIFFGVVVFWGSYWKSPERMRFFTMTPPRNNATFFLHLKMDGWIRGSVRFFGEPFGFLFFWECRKNIKKISRNSLFVFFGDKKRSQVEFPMFMANKGHVLDRPARSASVQDVESWIEIETIEFVSSNANKNEMSRLCLTLCRPKNVESRTASAKKSRRKITPSE